MLKGVQKLQRFRNFSASQIRYRSKKVTAPKETLTNNKTEFGPLKDEDRIFQNLYGRHDWRLRGACQRGDWHRTKDLICKGPSWIMEQVLKAGLRGRGGAGFYAGIKWGFLKDFKNGKLKYVVVNGAEGEPGTCKDREIMRHEPHKVLEGLLLGGVVMGAQRGIIYVRSRFYNEACNLHFALAEAYKNGLVGKNACGSGIDFDIYIQRGDRYICGEETALINCLQGKQGRPKRKPPYLTEKGLFEHPSAVINVETLSILPTILRRGPQWFASLGRSYNAGTKLFNISGEVQTPCTVEEEMSIPLRQLIETHGGGVIGGWENIAAVFPGGTSTMLIGGDVAGKINMDFDSLEAAGSALGSAAIIVISKNADIMKILKRTVEFYKISTCKQCTQCREGSIWLYEIFSRFVKGNAQPEEVGWVEAIAKYMEGNTICALADGQANVARGLAKHFKNEVEDKIKNFRKS